MPRPCSSCCRATTPPRSTASTSYGATHFLVSPFTEPQLLHALQFARRHAERVGGGAFAPGRRRRDEDASWRWQPGSRTVELSPALARQAGLGEDDGRRISLMDLFRKLDPEGRRAARGAIDRLLATGEATAFAHAARRAARASPTMSGSSGEGGIVGRAETICRAASARRAGRDPLTGLRDGRAARAWLADRLGPRESRTHRHAAALGQPLRRDQRRLRPRDRRCGAAGGGAADRAPRRSGRPAAGWSRAWPAPSSRSCWRAPATLDDGRFLAGELVEAIGRPFVSGDHVITLGSRAGVAVSQPGDDAAALLRRASAALAEAKGADSAPVRVLEEGAESETARGDRLEVDLRRALDQDEIEIRFQPQVSVTGGAIVGVEALARWNHPQYGELGAADPVRRRRALGLSRPALRPCAAQGDRRGRRLAGSAAAPAPVGQHHRRRHRPPRLRRRSSSRWCAKAASRPSG